MLGFVGNHLTRLFVGLAQLLFIGHLDIEFHDGRQTALVGADFFRRRMLDRCSALLFRACEANHFRTLKFSLTMLKLKAFPLRFWTSRWLRFNFAHRLRHGQTLERVYRKLDWLLRNDSSFGLFLFLIRFLKVLGRHDHFQKRLSRLWLGALFHIEATYINIEVMLFGACQWAYFVILIRKHAIFLGLIFHFTPSWRSLIARRWDGDYAPLFFSLLL